MESLQSCHKGRPHSGLIDRSEQIEALTLTSIQYAPRLNLSNHHHDQACFALVLKGQFEESFRSCAFVCEPHTVLFRPPGELHADVVSAAGASCFLVEVSLAWMDDLRRHGQVSDSPVLVRGTAMPRLAERMYRLWRNPNRDPTVALELSALSYLLGAELLRRRSIPARSHRPLWLRRLYERLQECPQGSYDLRSLAESAGVHPSYLCRSFKTWHGVSITEFIRERRIQLAMELIRKEHDNLTHIAQKAGFVDQAHFSSVFRKHTGLTPSQYRQRQSLPRSVEPST